MTRRFKRFLLPPAVLLTAFVRLAAGGDWWLDNVKGSDEGDGSRAQPFATFERAVQALEPGDTLHFVPNTEPYPGDIRMLKAGHEDARIVLDGHGSRVGGLRRVRADGWTAEPDDIFRRPLRNNAWGMPHHWEGGFELVRFDGRPGRNVTSREELQPFSYFLYKNQQELKTDPLHNTLFIRLPAGRTPDDLSVETIVWGGGIYVAGAFVTVRNFVTEYGGMDGYSTHRAPGLVFENIEARYFMDQGMSHHGAQAVVRNAHFHHNAGCGIVDVYDEVRVRYENCLIEDDTWRGGVELLSGEFEMIGCVIRNNPKKALNAGRGARVRLRNCLFVGPAEDRTAGIGASGPGAELIIENCTFYRFGKGLQGNLEPGARMEVRRCAFVDCELNVNLILVEHDADKPVDLDAAFAAEANLYSPGDWNLIRRTRREEQGWKVSDRTFGPDAFEAWRDAVGADGDSTVRDLPDITAADLATTALELEPGKPVGARLPEGVWP